MQQVMSGSVYTQPLQYFFVFSPLLLPLLMVIFCGILLFHRIKAVDFFPLVSAEFSLLSSAYTSLMPLMMMIYAYSHLLNIFDTVSLTCTQFKGGLYS